MMSSTRKTVTRSRAEHPDANPRERLGKPIPAEGERRIESVLVIQDLSMLSGELAYIENVALRWGSRLVNIGRAGHTNAASGLGEWREGLALLKLLTGETTASWSGKKTEAIKRGIHYE